MHPQIAICLGNPDEKYKLTRHNVGFMLADKLAKKFNASHKKYKNFTKFNVKIDAGELFVIKPLTYVNNTGIVIIYFLRKYPELAKYMIVVCDDCNLPVGKLRIRKKGSSGGHNGLQSIIDAMQTDEFARIRIGVGRPLHSGLKDYVLDKFTPDELKIINEAIKKTIDALLVWTQNGIEKCMNVYNVKA